MEEKNKKIFTQEFSILETKNSLLKEPECLNDNCALLEMGLPDLYKIMEKERYSLPKLEDIDKRINILKTQENVDQDIIYLLEKMKKDSMAQNSTELSTMQYKGFINVQDMVRNEHNNMVNGIQQTMDEETVQLIKKQIESDPKVFRSKYPELLDYITSLEE